MSVSGRVWGRWACAGVGHVGHPLFGPCCCPRTLGEGVCVDGDVPLRCVNVGRVLHLRIPVCIAPPIPLPLNMIAHIHLYVCTLPVPLSKIYLNSLEYVTFCLCDDITKFSVNFLFASAHEITAPKH